MPSRPVRPDPSLPAIGALRQIVLPDVTIDIGNPKWFRPLPPNIKLPPGTLAPDLLRVPIGDANKVLRGIIHLVADIPADAPKDVVWVDGANELRVLLDRTTLTCAPGFVTVSLTVECEELREPQRLDVAFAVGRKDKPTGLLMSTFDRVQGPALIAEYWSGALSAFAWEALVTTAQQLAGAVGKDAGGKPLVPGSIAADTDALLLGAMSRTALNWTGGQ